jgi:hypothetical protein
MAQESPATLAQALRRIFAGRREWRRLAKANGVTGDTLVVIMPHEGSELNRIALGLLDRLARQKRPDKTLILTPSREALGGGQPLPCGAEARVVEAPAEALWRIMDFYCLYRFHRYLYVVSLTAPRGAAGGELVGVNGITEEELVRLAVLRLRS